MAEGKKSTGPKMKQAGNKAPQIDLNRPNEEQMSIKEKLMNQPKVMVSLNSTGDARTVIIDGVEYLSEGDVERVKIGGVPWFIPRGVMVEVPKAVAELLNNNKVTVNYFNGELKRNFKNNYQDILKYSNI